MDDLLTTDACTLPTAERLLRVAELEALFAEAVRDVEPDGDVVRLRMTGPTGLYDRVRDLAARESACCSFFTFDLAGSDADLVLTVAVPPAYRAILAALADRVTELSA